MCVRLAPIPSPKPIFKEFAFCCRGGNCIIAFSAKIHYHLRPCFQVTSPANVQNEHMRAAAGMPTDGKTT